MTMDYTQGGIAYSYPIFVNTYADVVSQSIGEFPKMFVCFSSEINDGNQTIYTYDGAGNIFWVASTKVN
jgi:hypothetical protein